MLDVPVEFLWGITAVIGGIARYLSSLGQGKKPFSLFLLFSSAFMAGFSGYMFALLFEAWGFPNPYPHIAAGVGGFFGEQTMKYIYEKMTSKLN